MSSNKPIWFDQPSSDTEVTTINIGDISPHKIMVCTPVHGDTSMHYTQSVLKFQQDCVARKIMCSFTLYKSSLVTQGRNLCVAEMMNHKDNYTHLLFIDSDIDFQSSTIFAMLEKDKDVIACPYPLKSFDWDKAWRRLTVKKDIKNADQLSKAGYTFPLKVPNKDKVIVEEGIAEVTHAPTGCMLIKRNVFEKMMKHYPDHKIYQPNFVNGKERSTENFYNFFDTLHDKKTKRYYGEDFGFCQIWGEMGGKIYVYVKDFITHVGEYQYCGRFWDELTHMKRVDPKPKIK